LDGVPRLTIMYFDICRSLIFSASFLPAPLIRLGASRQSTFSHKGRRERRTSPLPRCVSALAIARKSGSGAHGLAYRNLNTWHDFRAPPVSVATVDRSRAPLHVLSMDNDARMIRLPSTKHWRFAWECRPVGRPRNHGFRSHGGRSPPSCLIPGAHQVPPER
jgi:hypothetical protein